MGSERERAGYEQQQQPESHKLCANNCGCFGTAATLNLCSKCYRDYCLKEEQEASAKSAVKKSLNTGTNQSQQLLLLQREEDVIYKSVDDAASSSSSLASSSPSDLENSSAVLVESLAVVVKNRCFSCNKRVGLTGFKCRCGNTFCGTHRYAEKHDCGFDYKKAAREAIAKANPVVKAGKLEMI